MESNISIREPLLHLRRRHRGAAQYHLWTSTANQVFVLFGPARSGKSTLLRLLNRLSDLNEGARHQGEIYFNGQDIFARGVDVTDLRRRISMVFAIPTPLPGTIRDNLTYGLKMAGIKNAVDAGGAGRAVAEAGGAVG